MEAGRGWVSQDGPQASGWARVFSSSLSLSLFFFFLALWHVGFSFPDQGSNPCFLQWRDGVLTTGLPEKSLFKSSFWDTVWRNRGSSLISIPKMCSSSMKIPWLEVTWLSWYQRSREVPPPTAGSIAMFPIIRMSRAGHKNQAITDGGHCPWNWKRPRKTTYSSPLLLVYKSVFQVLSKDQQNQHHLKAC